MHTHTCTEIYMDRWYDLYSAQVSNSTHNALVHIIPPNPTDADTHTPPTNQDGRLVMKRRPRPHPSGWGETVAMRLRRYGQTRHTLLRNLLVAPVTEVVRGLCWCAGLV